MNFILYSDINERSIGHNLGRPEYSYYFVLKAYRPILESLGQVHLVQSTDEVDPLYRQLHEQGEDCLFLSFTPPHKAARGLQCPMLCVVAWEFESIPDVAWDGDPAQDWSQVLAGHGAAITLSEQTARAVRRVLGEDFPVLALPTPIWEDFAAIRQQGERNPVKSGETLQLKGCVIDSRLLGLSADGLIAPIRKRPRTRSSRSSPRRPPSPSPNRSLSQNQSQSRFLSTGGADWSSASTTCCCGTGKPSATWYPYRYAAGCSVTCAGRCRPRQRRWKRCRSHCPRPSSRYRPPSPSIRRRCCRTSTSTSRSSWTGWSTSRCSIRWTGARTGIT